MTKMMYVPRLKEFMDRHKGKAVIRKSSATNFSEHIIEEPQLLYGDNVGGINCSLCGRYHLNIQNCKAGV